MKLNDQDIKLLKLLTETDMSWTVGSLMIDQRLHRPVLVKHLKELLAAHYIKIVLNITEESDKKLEEAFKVINSVADKELDEILTLIDNYGSELFSLDNVVTITDAGKDAIFHVEKWFKTIQISTYVGNPPNGKDEPTGGDAVLIVMHQHGNNKERLISQLKTMIHGIENDFDYFAG